MRPKEENVFILQLPLALRLHRQREGSLHPWRRHITLFRELLVMTSKAQPELAFVAFLARVSRAFFAAFSYCSFFRRRLYL